MTCKPFKPGPGAWGFLVTALALGQPVSAAPSAAMLTQACAGCHGTGGASVGPSMPSLAGQSKLAIVESMQAFKSGVRPSTVMGRLSKAYTDADFEAMGEFFASQKRYPPSASADAAKAARGSDLHDRHCARCHVDDGKEIKDNSPIVAGQWARYLEIQVRDYAAGRRKMFDRKEEKMKPLSLDELEAIAHYYASIK